MNRALSAPSRLRTTARVMRTTVALALLAGGAACSNSTEPKEAGPNGANDDDPPATITQLPRTLSAGEVKVRDAANEFSFALLGTVTASEATKNTFISPLSASFAVGMVANGAATKTWEETQAALKLSGMTQPEINAGYKTLIELLLSLDPSVQMKIANSIWYRDSIAFHQTFFDTTKKYFNAEVKGLNFSDKVASLSTINGWVATATNDRIKKVLEDIVKEDVMFLINAIYFKGNWRDKFEVAKTRNETFTPSSGAAQTVPMMHRTGKMQYTENSAYQAVDLPYGNSAFTMTVILPKAGQDVNTLTKSFTAASFASLAGSFREGTVDLSLPKLKLEYDRALTDDFKALGMKQAFIDGGADFSRMTDAPVFISFIKQNSFVNVDEEGTEAAAVTTIGVQLTSAPLSVTMRVDRPYLFVIRERLSGTIMFMGRIVRIP